MRRGHVLLSHGHTATKAEQKKLELLLQQALVVHTGAEIHRPTTEAGTVCLCPQGLFGNLHSESPKRIHSQKNVAPQPAQPGKSLFFDFLPPWRPADRARIKK